VAGSQQTAAAESIAPGYRRAAVQRFAAREVVTDAGAHYFGAEVSDGALTQDDEPIVGTTRFEDWLSRVAIQR
jgi:hypothetical protein